jgi:hypothetical protein
VIVASQLSSAFQRCVLHEIGVGYPLAHLLYSLTLKQCALENVSREVLNDQLDELLSSMKSRDRNIVWFLRKTLPPLMLLPLQERFALQFREQLALRRQLYVRPFEQMYGGAYLWQRDELFRAQRYVFVET